MQIQFLGDDEFVELLPNGRVVELVRLHNAVNRPEDVSFKEVLDKHYGLDLRDKLESAVIVVVLQFPEQPQRLTVVASGIEQKQRRIAHDGLQIVQQRMGAKQRPDQAGSGRNDEIVFRRLGGLRERRAQLRL